LSRLQLYDKQSKFTCTCVNRQFFSVVMRTHCVRECIIIQDYIHPLPCPMMSLTPSKTSMHASLRLVGQPFMADCRHLACASCWSQWLQKSSTCPKCRAIVFKEQLTRVVFKRISEDSKPPTLSQLFKESPVEKECMEVDESSDDELDVIGMHTDGSRVE
jgi:Zinc finger, C3HC4 type (RING finger)